jgi:flagellar M-ring protein FliF
MVAPGTQLEKHAPVAEGSALTAGASAVWARAQLAWAAMPPHQRRWAITAGSVLLASFAALAWLGLRTEWKVLYSGLDPQDAREVGLTLTQAQIPFDVADSGMTLRVPATSLDKARLATAAKGVKSGRMGFELFDKPNWVGSEFDERVNFQRALEGELEHTVGSLADVESARVHLVMPHESLFRSQERPAKASVVLKLRRASISDGEADSIRNLVASAVDGLTPDQVVLVDASGRLTLGPRTPEALQLSAEHALEEKLISTLEAVTGVSNVRASVAIEYDPDAVDETKETYDPTQSATLSMQRTELTAGGQPVAAGVPGTASNVPNAQSLPVYPKQSTAPQSSKEESGTYGVSKTTRHLIQNPGKVRRLTAAIVVNDRLTQAATRGKSAQWQPRSADELRNLNMLAQAAVGFDQSRGDVVTVQNLAFEENRMQTSSSLPAQIFSRIETSPALVKYVSLLIGLVIVFAFGVRPALRKTFQQAGAATRELSGAAVSDAQALLPATGAIPPDPDRLRAQEVLEQVTKQIRSEPAQSTRLLQSWIHSD